MRSRGTPRLAYIIPGLGSKASRVPINLTACHCGHIAFEAIHEPPSARAGARHRAAHSLRPSAPPRGMQDMSCVNCGKKGHMADKCNQPKVDRKDQPCFGCGKTGHQSRDCPERKKRPDSAGPVPSLASPKVKSSTRPSSAAPVPRGDGRSEVPGAHHELSRCNSKGEVYRDE